MVLFWILIIAGAALIIRWLTAQTRPGASASQETALDILKRRYAGGEISRKEFERMKADLH